MADKKKNTKKKTSKKKNNKKPQAKHSASNVKKNNTKKSTKKKTTNKKQNKSSKKKVAKKLGLAALVKSKLPKKKPEPKTAKEKRLLKLQQLRASKKKKKILKIAGISAAGLYVFGCILFSIVCFPRTIVADTDLSFHSPSFMRAALIPNSGEYVFRADGLDFELEIDGKDIDYNFDVDQVVERILELKNPLLWPYEVFILHDFMTESVVSYNKEVATAKAKPAIEAHNLTAIPPEDANLICDYETKDISIKDEVMGTLLDPDRALASVLGYIGSGRRHLECGPDEQVCPKLYADDDRCEEAIPQAETLVESILSLSMGEANVATLNLRTWCDWLKLKEGYVAGLNDQILDMWAAALANQCDTLGKTRTFVTPYGKTCTVEGGDPIGWQIDQDALKTMVEKEAKKGQIQALVVPCSSTLNGYAGPGQRDWGARYIDVDLSQQQARMYNEAGVLIWQAPIVSGKPGRNTPTGVYTIKQVGGPTTLIGNIDPATGKPEYETRVEYWMPFIGNAIGFHDAPWQPTFGGDWYITNGSHGCINLSTSNASKLHSLCAYGDIVVVHK